MANVLLSHGARNLGKAVPGKCGNRSIMMPINCRILAYLTCMQKCSRNQALSVEAVVGPRAIRFRFFPDWQNLLPAG